MLLVLLAKDLRRARRNPLPYVIFLAVPLVITGLLGLVFGSAGEEKAKALGRIRFAVVDEDDSMLTQFLRGTANQGQGAQHLEPVFLPREDALRQVTNNQLSAALIIPTNFTRNYVTGREPVTLRLVKNPAQSFHPAILEELLNVLVSGLNAIGRSFHAELQSWQRTFDRTDDLTYRAVADEIVRTGDRLQSVRRVLFPPLISYESTTQAEPVSASAAAAKPPAETKPQATNNEPRTTDNKPSATKPSPKPADNFFAFILPGLAAMFLLFLADVSLRDLYREVRLHTFERYCTLPQRVFTFVGAKVVFALLMLMLCAAILFVGGARLFRFEWTRPGPLAMLVISYGFFAAGFMALVAALAGNERRADVFGNVVSMLLGMAGGCMFPARNLPGFVRDHLTPWMPPNWLVEAARDLQNGAGGSWAWTALKLGVLGLLLVTLSAWLHHARLRKGGRA